jgi:hypothetical protein
MQDSIMLSQQNAKATSASQKYDVLTALGAHALAGGKTQMRLGLRFITLITARYNWARNELAVGQREIARLWSVDERTVKREMAKLRALGWLVVKRQGTRGRCWRRRAGSGRMWARTSTSGCRARRSKAP